jgi:hypothetical protein
MQPHFKIKIRIRSNAAISPTSCENPYRAQAPTDLLREDPQPLCEIGLCEMELI